jgi:cytochrome c
MSRSPEFPAILGVTGWAVAATVAAFVFATTGQRDHAAAPEATGQTAAPAPAGTDPEQAATADAAGARPAAEDPAAEATPQAAPEAAPQATADADMAETATVAATAAASPAGTPLGLGRPALPEEVAAWDLAVLPDGTGLPEGSGDVETGDMVFSENCASCHGDFAEGLDSWPVLAGGAGSLGDARPVKTIGSYWPHLSTVFDYVHRSMPFGQAQTLSVDDTYAITAFLLYSNGLVEDDFVLSNENFTEIVMPNAGGFYVDDRPATEYPQFSTEPCMENCRTAAPEVMKRAIDLNVTPEDADGRPAGTLPVIALVAAEAEAEAGSSGATVVSGAAEADAAAPAAGAGTAAGGPQAAPVADAELAAAGEAVFRKCAACHKVGDGAKNGVGPVLNGVVGRPIAAAEGFSYSGKLTELGAAGGTWDAATLQTFLQNPKTFAPGTKMAFAGLREQADRDAVIAYLATFGP